MGFQWTSKRLLAAQRLAQAQHTEAEIARQLGIGERTLRRWKAHPEFAGQVQEHLDTIRAAVRQAILSEGIADLVERLKAYHARWKAMQAVITARAAELADEVPGGETGLLVRHAKRVEVEHFGPPEKGEEPRGPRREIVYEYLVDTGLLRELREIEKQAAQEVGDWVEKRELAGPNGAPLLPPGLTEALDQAYGEAATGGTDAAIP